MNGKLNILLDYPTKTILVIKNSLLLILTFFCFVYCSEKSNFNQEQKEIIKSIEDGFFYKAYSQPENRKFNSQKEADQFLLKKFSENEIETLLKDENPFIKVVFFGALAEKNLDKAFELFMENIGDKEIFLSRVMFVNEDFDVSKGEISTKWYYKIYNLMSEKQQKRFGDTLVAHYNKKEFSHFYENYLNYIQHPPKSMQNESLYKHIKMRLSKNDIPLYKGNNDEKISFLIGLSVFKKEEDVAYLKRHLESILVSDNNYMMDNIIGNFPHPDFFEIFKQYYESNKQTCVDNSVFISRVFNQYPNTESLLIMEDMIKNSNLHSEYFYGNKFEGMTKEKYVKTQIYSELNHPYFSTFKKKLESEIDKNLLEHTLKIKRIPRTY